MLVNRWVWAFTTLAFTSLSPLGADEKDYSKPIVKKAIRAIGGPKNFNKLHGFVSQTALKVKAPGNNNPIEGSGTWTFHKLDHFHADLFAIVNGNNVGITLGMTGKSGWIRGNQQKPNKMPQEIQKFLRGHFVAIRLVHQPNYLQQQGFKLSPLGELEINGKPTMGLSVAKKGLPPIEIYYSKKTALPARLSLRGKEPKQAEEHTYTFDFSAFKEFDGIKHFSKMIFRRDDIQYAEFTLSSVQFSEGIEKSNFAKPGEN